MFAASAFVHAPVASLHESVVQPSMSSHVDDTPHEPLAWHIPHVTEFPSLQRAPVFEVHDVVLLPGLQNWHGLPGFAAPAA